MDKEELKTNEEALARRQKKKPSGKNNQITLVPLYCKGCGLCVAICPTGTLQLLDDAENKYGTAVKVDAPDYCIGCKLCESQCPDFAIFVNYDNEKKEGAK